MPTPRTDSTVPFDRSDPLVRSFLAYARVLARYHRHNQSSLRTPTWLLRLFSGERYEGTRMQFGVLGPHLVPTLLPFPVQITHVVSNPLPLGDRAAARRSRTALVRLHQRVVAQCQAFLDAAVAQRERDAPLLDRVIRGGERIAQGIGI
jgi:hypothetical protein